MFQQILIARVHKVTHHLRLEIVVHEEPEAPNGRLADLQKKNHLQNSERWLKFFYSAAGEDVDNVTVQEWVI